MGHDHHFLERLDRASREEADFALSLYRDHEALRQVLDSARLPADAERVALEIAPGGPHVIVQREGQFVTCLGRGMAVGPHPVIARARLDALLASVADLRARRSIAQRVERPGEGEGELFARLINRADGLGREEFIGISGWQPLLAPRFYRMAHEHLATTMAQSVGRHQPGPAKGAKARETAYARWKIFWTIGHQWLLATMGSKDYLLAHIASLEGKRMTFSGAVLMLGSTRLSMRTWWGAARIGKPLVAVCKQRLVCATNWFEAFDAMMSLTAIGLRHSSLRAEMQKVVLAPRTYADDELTQRHAVLVPELAIAFDDPDAQARAFLDWGREHYLERSAHLPEGSPYRFAGVADVPDDLARTVLLGRDLDLYADDEAVGLVVASLSTIARAKAQDFYLPREVESLLHVPFTPERAHELFGRSVRGAAEQEPVRAGKKTGRNEACPCGSGNKYKRCCGR
jgi:hypothetical protein